MANPRIHHMRYGRALILILSFGILWHNQDSSRYSTPLVRIWNSRWADMNCLEGLGGSHLQDWCLAQIRAGRAGRSAASLVRPVVAGRGWWLPSGVVLLLPWAGFTVLQAYQCQPIASSQTGER